MMGLELSLALMLGHLGTEASRLARLVETMSSRPAAIVGLAPPSIAEGAIAELVLVDPSERWTPEAVDLRSKSRNTPFLHHELTGRALWTMANGRVVHDTLSDVQPGGPR
jgi:dihydroorotase